MRRHGIEGGTAWALRLRPFPAVSHYTSIVSGDLGRAVGTQCYCRAHRLGTRLTRIPGPPFIV